MDAPILPKYSWKREQTSIPSMLLSMHSYLTARSKECYS
uniref:Uncharacterized protein n=1 Tax=Arundo donax TaxID=35708 RepID=A0A0A9C3J2_ARUDO